MPTIQKKSLNLRLDPYQPLSNTLVHKGGLIVICTIIYGEYPYLDNLYANALNYDTKWQWAIKEAYHEMVMAGKIVCPVEY
jgi:hypothetical protein